MNKDGHGSSNSPGANGNSVGVLVSDPPDNNASKKDDEEGQPQNKAYPAGLGKYLEVIVVSMVINSSTQGFGLVAAVGKFIGAKACAGEGKVVDKGPGSLP